MVINADKLKEECESMMHKWLAQEYDKEVKKIRLRFDDKLPKIGERCLIKTGNVVYFGHRSSENFYQTGSLFIRTDDENILVVSLVET